MSATVSNAELLASYERGVSELQAAVDQMTAEQLQARPIAGKWSTLEVVCHIVDSDIYFTDRIERTLALERPLLMVADERPFPERIRYQDLDLADELALFAVLRRRTARILRLQPDAAWERVGVHSEAGVLTVRDMVAKAVRHVAHHLVFIAEKRAALAAAATKTLATERVHEHHAAIAWSNHGPNFLKGQYSREHTWTFDGGVTVPASPSPAIVPKPWSNAAHVDPEEALVASVASCHMLTFLWLASKQGWEVASYTDAAVGRLTKNERGQFWLSRITLRPKITWANDRHPTAAQLGELHHRSHDECFIANSVRSEIVVE